MSRQGSRNSWALQFPQSLNTTSSASQPSLPTFRFPGDGLDHRRPTMSQPAPNVIDLTTEPDSPTQPISLTNASTSTSTRANRGPRYSREDIIDLIDDDNDNLFGDYDSGIFPDTDETLPNTDNNTSPDVEILGSRPLRQPDPPPPAPPPQGIAAYTALLRNHSNRASHHPEGVHLPSIPGASLIRSLWNYVPGGPAGDAVANVLNSEDMYRSLSGSRPHLPHTRFHRAMAWQRGPQEHITPPGWARHRVPHDLDFESQGFQLGHESPPRRVPAFKPPPPARLGFTRSPREDDEIVCPNCERELGVGEGELERQVWVVKNCGHVGCSTL